MYAAEFTRPPIAVQTGVILIAKTKHCSVIYRLRGTSLANPALVYAAVWIGVLILFSLNLSHYMSAPNSDLVMLVSANVLVSTLVFWVFSRGTKNKSTLNQSPTKVILLGHIDIMRAYVDMLAYVWLFGSLIIIFVSGGLPLLWLISGDDSRSYVDFGIPTVSGFFAACGMFASIAVFLDCLLTGSRRRLWIIVAVAAFQIATINRGGLIWIVIEMLGVYLLVVCITWVRFMKILAFIFGMILLFGVIGDLRSGKAGGEAFTATMSESGREVFSVLPSGFYWVYIYTCVGITNVNAAMPTLEPLGVPYWSTVGVMPTIIRDKVYNFEDADFAKRYPLDMVSPMFNVFTLYGGILADFGIKICVFWTGVMALVAAYFYVNATRGQIWAVLAYAVMFQVIVLSIYWDNFTSWVAMFQFVLAFGLRNRIRRALHRRIDAEAKASTQAEIRT